MSHIIIHSEQEMEQLGTELALVLTAPLLIYLHGDLGAGKTTLVRAVLKALGHQGGVKSPTYTLVESYHLAKVLCYHFDFYRVNDVQELEYMGIRDYLADNALFFIEWPERGNTVLPMPDLSVHISYDKAGRVVEIKANSEQGMAALAKINLKAYRCV